MLIWRRPIGSMSYIGGVMSLPEPFCWSWGQMIQFNNEHLCGPGEYVHLERSRTSDRSWARNELASKFLGDWLLQVDIDHVFEPDLCARLVGLLESYDLDVLTGVYYSKTPPHAPLLHTYDENQAAWRIIAEWPETAKFIEIGRTGAGCLLVRRRVFDRIREELHENPFDVYPGYWRSEDFSFFKRLEKLAIKAYAAAKVEARHLTYHPLTGTDFRKELLETYTPGESLPLGEQQHGT